MNRIKELGEEYRKHNYTFALPLSYFPSRMVGKIGLEPIT
jgi:hypothetical protein